MRSSMDIPQFYMLDDYLIVFHDCHDDLLQTDANTDR